METSMEYWTYSLQICSLILKYGDLCAQFIFSGHFYRQSCPYEQFSVNCFIFSTTSWALLTGAADEAECLFPSAQRRERRCLKHCVQFWFPLYRKDIVILEQATQVRDCSLWCIRREVGLFSLKRSSLSLSTTTCWEGAWSIEWDVSWTGCEGRGPSWSKGNSR